MSNPGKIFMTNGLKIQWMSFDTTAVSSISKMLPIAFSNSDNTNNE